MSKQFAATVKKIEGLRTELFRAHSSFRAFEVIQEMRAPNIIGKTEASRNAKAMGDFKGFFNTAEHALNAEFLVSLAKLYDEHPNGTSLPKLLKYIRGNVKYLKLQDFLEHNKGRSDLTDRRQDYKGITLHDIEELEGALEKLSPQIRKLKIVRDKKVAHLEMKNLEDLQVEETPKDLRTSRTKIEDLTYDEIDNLIKAADKILNSISSQINRDIAEFGPLKQTVTQDSQRLIREVRKIYDLLPSGRGDD
jgi:hypothetical protein